LAAEPASGETIAYNKQKKRQQAEMHGML